MSGGDLFVVRHGATQWSASGQHTGRTDLALSEEGQKEAKSLRDVLSDHLFEKVISSPLRRAVETCEIAGFGERCEKTEDLAEWDYGDYEGLTTEEIRKDRPSWSIFEDGCPNGEPLFSLSDRADRVLGRLQGEKGDVLVFSHGHFLRVLIARWIGLPGLAGRLWKLESGSVSVMSYEREIPVLSALNLKRQLEIH